MLFCLPLVAFGVVGFFWMRGDIEFERFREGTGETLAVIGFLILLLFLVASASLPTVHAGVKALSRGCERRKAIVRGAEPGSKLLSAILLPILLPTHFLAWVARLALILASFALIAGIGVFSIRLIEPGFLQDWIDRILAYFSQAPQ